jgi:hypothetical protein
VLTYAAIVFSRGVGIHVDVSHHGRLSGCGAGQGRWPGHGKHYQADDRDEPLPLTHSWISFAVSSRRFAD